MKKCIALIMAVCLVLCLCACGGGVSQADFDALEAEVEQLRADVDALQGNGADAEEAEEAESAEENAEEEADDGAYDPMVDSIDLVLDEGELKYTGFEEANAGLTDYDNALVFTFEFTNFETMPAETQDNFRIQFFQNGAELDDMVSYSSNGGAQYDLVGAYFNEALNGGTVSFGSIVVPNDDSPITVMVSRNGGSDDTECQMMEVDIAGGADTADTADSAVSAEQVDDDLQGDWILAVGTGGAFSFDDGNVTVSNDGAVISGTYVVNTEDSMVDATLTATDGLINIHLPYYYEDGALVITNNDAEVFVKQ